jgi:hypothetical protein
MALPTLDAVFASAADLPRRMMLAQWLVNIQYSGSVADYATLPERYLWAKIAVAAGAPKTEADYISLPNNYVWKAIYDAASGTSNGLLDWNEKRALGHIAAAYRGDTGNAGALATYIDWPWRYQVASIITNTAIDADAQSFITTSGATDKEGIDQFVKGIKNLGLWSSMVCWPLRSTQNAGTGTTVYSLGGRGTFNGTLVNGPTWGTNGIDFVGLNRNMGTSLSFSQPQTIFFVFARASISVVQRIYGPNSELSLIRSSGGSILASAGNSITVGTITIDNANLFYTSQIEFNEVNSTSSFNRSSKTQINLGTQNNSGFVIGSDSAGVRGILTPFAGVFSATSIDLIHDLYLETLGVGLPLP